MTLLCQKQKNEIVEQIEDHFYLLTNSLSERKEKLLKIISGVFEQHKKSKGELEIKTPNCESYATNKFDNDSIHFQLSSLYACELIKRTQTSLDHDQKYSVVLPNDLLATIESYGRVLIGDEPVPEFEAAIVSTIFGFVSGTNDGVGNNAQFANPFCMTINPLDNCMYICDNGNNKIRRMTKAGEAFAFAPMDRPMDIVFYAKENCFFVSEDATHSIKRVSLSGEVTKYAGTGKSGYKDGPSNNAQFFQPRGITVDQQTGVVYVVDRANQLIRSISPDGIVSTLTGTLKKMGFADGGKHEALFNEPWGICFDQQLKALFVCDCGNSQLRNVSLNGVVTTLCSIPNPNVPVVLADGTILVSSNSHKIFKITENGKVEVFAGSGMKGYNDGKPEKSSFCYPSGLWADLKTRTCFVVDRGNNRIRAIKFR